MTSNDPLIIGNTQLENRFFLGTGKFGSKDDMRKRKKKRIGVVIDDDGRYLNCYGKEILWTRKELSRAKRKAKRISQQVRWY